MPGKINQIKSWLRLVLIPLGIFLSVLCSGMAVQNNLSFCWTSQSTFWHFSLFCVWEWLILLNITKNVLTFFSLFCVWEWLILLNIIKNVLTFFSLFCVWEWLSRTIHHFAEYHKECSDIFLSLLCAGMAVQNNLSFCWTSQRTFWHFSLFCVWEWLILLNNAKNVLTFFYPFCVWKWLSRTIHHFTECHKEHFDIFLSILCAGVAVQTINHFCWMSQRTFWHFSLCSVCGNGCPEQFIILLNITKNIISVCSWH